MKFFLISDNTDTQMGMRLAGIEGIVVSRPEEVTDALEKMGLPATIRGETFTLEQFARLGSLLYKGGPA